MVHTGPGLPDGRSQQNIEVTTNTLFYFNVIIKYLSRYFDENSWGLDCVHKKETVSTLSGLVAEEVVSQVFNFYTRPLLEESGTDDFSVNQEKISRYILHTRTLN